VEILLRVPSKSQNWGIPILKKNAVLSFLRTDISTQTSACNYISSDTKKSAQERLWGKIQHAFLSLFARELFGCPYN